MAAVLTTCHARRMTHFVCSCQGDQGFGGQTAKLCHPLRTWKGDMSRLCVLPDGERGGLLPEKRRLAGHKLLVADRALGGQVQQAGGGHCG